MTVASFPPVGGFFDHRFFLDRIKGTHRGKGGVEPVTMSLRLVQKGAEGETSYEFSWKVKLIIKLNFDIHPSISCQLRAVSSYRAT